MTSQSGSARCYFNLRLLAVAVISFLTGHQLKNLQYLFRSTTLSGVGGTSSTADGVWAPATTFDKSVAEETKEPQKTQRATRPPPRFDASNYPNFELLPWSLPQPTPLRYLTSEEFMRNYIASKRENNILLPWEDDDTYEDKNVSLPLPIIALNFPKSATTTMDKFFGCGGLTSMHTGNHDGRFGLCMMDNHINDKPPLDGCNIFRNLKREERSIECYSDIGFVGEKSPPCYYSSLHDGGLEDIVKHYPNATILLVTRNATAWARSMFKWANLRKRWTNICGFDGRLQPHESVQRDNMVYWNSMFNQSRSDDNEEEYWINFYHAHTQKIREFAMDHMSLTYVEVELENENIGKILQQYTKVSPDCLMECHPGKWMYTHNVSSPCHPIGQNPALLKEQPIVPEKEDIEDGEDAVSERGGDASDDDTDDDDNDDDIGMEVGYASTNKESLQAVATKEEKTKKTWTKKKRVKKPRRFDGSNYTSDFQPLPWTLPKPTPLRSLTSEEFMVKYIAAKRKLNIALPWEDGDKYADKNVSLPLPIIALNFPKSATLTMKAFFDCGGLTSIHTSTQDGRIGICMMENHLINKPPLDGCNTHRPRDYQPDTVFPIDFISDIGLQGPPCYYASLHDGGLENIALHYPNSTILLVTRNATAWARSMAKWGSILIRWSRTCGFDGRLQPDTYWQDLYDSSSPENKKEEYWVNFYHAHTQKIREFALKHLALTYVEVELENENVGEILQQYTKISPDCLLDCHPGPKWIKLNNATSQCHPIGQNPAHVANKMQSIGPKEEGSDTDDEDGAGSGDGGGGTDGNDDDDTNRELLLYRYKTD